MDTKELTDLITEKPLDEIRGESWDLVFSRNDLDFVVRLPKPNQEILPWLKGYDAAMNKLGGKIARFSIASLGKIKGRTKSGSRPNKAIVQEKVADYFARLKQLVDGRRITQAISLVHSLADLDREIIARGCFPSDISFRKYGINKNGEIVRYELGDIEIYSLAPDHTFREGKDPGLQNSLNMRGLTHYIRLYELERLDHRVKIAYQARIGLDFNDEILEQMSKVKVDEGDIKKWQKPIFHVLDHYKSRMPSGYEQDKLQTVLNIMKSEGNIDVKRLVWGMVWRHKYSDQFVHLARQELFKFGFGTKEPVPSTEFVTPYAGK